MIDSGYAAYHTLLQRYPFDFVIASSHLVDRLDPYYPEFWQSYRQKGNEAARLGVERYFASTLEHLIAYQNFDTYAHLDYIILYAPGKRSYSYAEYADSLDAILKRLIELEKALEVNTGGYKYGLGVPNPQPEVLRRYRELGGELVTVGSDAHRAEDVGRGLKDAKSLLRSAGFTHTVWYQNRTPHPTPLDEP